ncbi:syntaxin binding protein 1 [Microbotryomycetes sp. JL221]|nr:syntaxin binding protein 1 [Microbotryomycetes sp. JL221]
MYRDGVPEGDKKRLYQHARLALHEMDAVDNLKYLGVNLTKDSGKKRRPIFKQREDDDAYDISRFQPALKFMLESLFPFVRDAPAEMTKTSSVSSSILRGSNNSAALNGSGGSLRSARPQWTSTTRGRKPVNEPRQRLLMFVAGGMTYSEIRACYKLSEAHNKDVLIGSTDVLTPEHFVHSLSDLERGSGPRGPTAGPRQQSTSMVPEPKQVSMDRRYSTQPLSQAGGPGTPLRGVHPSSQSSISSAPSNRSPNVVSHSPTPSQLSDATSGTSALVDGGDAKKKKKKLFGFRS